jgi:hypothetical protein
MILIYLSTFGLYFIVFDACRLISRMFEAMSGNFAHPEDIRLFVNVINGSLALHPEVSAYHRMQIAQIPGQYTTTATTQYRKFETNISEKELRGSNFYIHVSVSDLYILLHEKMWTDPGNIYIKSLTDT